MKLLSIFKTYKSWDYKMTKHLRTIIWFWYPATSKCSPIAACEMTAIWKSALSCNNLSFIDFFCIMQMYNMSCWLVLFNSMSKIPWQLSNSVILFFVDRMSFCFPGTNLIGSSQKGMLESFSCTSHVTKHRKSFRKIFQKVDVLGSNCTMINRP